MLADLETIAWKETKHVAFAVNQFAYYAKACVFLVLFAGLLPLWKGEQLLYSNGSFVLWLWVVAIVNLELSINAFMGERDNGSLDVLLASRMPDGAIVFGKLAAYTIYGSLFVLALAIVSCGALYGLWGAGVVRITAKGFPWMNTLLLLLTCVYGSLVSAATGMYYSLKARNWDQAQAYIRFGYFAVSVPLFIIYSVVTALGEQLSATGAGWFVVATVTALFTIYAAWSVARVARRFKRFLI